MKRITLVLLGLLALIPLFGFGDCSSGAKKPQVQADELLGELVDTQTADLPPPFKRPLAQPVDLERPFKKPLAVEPGSRQTQVSPLSAVVVTQCGGLVVAYITGSDGKLYRYDVTSGIPAADVLVLADQAPAKERVEVNCDKVQT